MGNLRENCPHCQIGLANDDGTNGVLGVELPGVYDGVLYWQCPDCGGRWHRWPESHRLHARACEYVEAAT